MSRHGGENRPFGKHLIDLPQSRMILTKFVHYFLSYSAHRQTDRQTDTHTHKHIRVTVVIALSPLLKGTGAKILRFDPEVLSPPSLRGR